MNIQTLSPALHLFQQEFDGVQVRGALLLGSERALIWDPLILPQALSELAALIGERPLVLAYSHADWDHVWGACAFPAATRVIAHTLCAGRFSNPLDVAATLAEYQASFPDLLTNVCLRPPTETFESSYQIDLGGLSVELQHLPGHTADSCVALIPEASVLLCGDCAELPIPTLNEENPPLESWISALEQLAQNARLTTCIPSHGDCGDRSLLQYNAEYLKAIASDRAFKVPYLLDSFYQDADCENRRIARSALSL
jgi:glyoxylase-like metal-dependent hydrolase (beta-lactamase superfamily II)